MSASQQALCANVIETVVFDLGGVLIEVDHDSATDWLAERGCEVSSIDEFVERSGMHAHERGELSSDEFLGRVNRMLARPATVAQLHAWWTGFFRPDPAMLDLARRLRGTCKVCILSNTGPLHWAQAQRQFALTELVDDGMASFEIGAAKPESVIYAAARERFGLRPERTVFIDDLEQNVRAARAAGWHAIHHLTPEQTRAGLRALGIALV